MLAVLSLVAAGTLGCSSTLDRGSTLYAEGRYVDAAGVLESAERTLASASPSEQATYGLYRGMTLLALGDLEGAARWLSYSRALVSSAADLLSQGELTLLAAGERHLAGARRQVVLRGEPDGGIGVATVQVPTADGARTAVP